MATTELAPGVYSFTGEYYCARCERVYHHTFMYKMEKGMTPVMQVYQGEGSVTLIWTVGGVQASVCSHPCTPQPTPEVQSDFADEYFGG